MKNLFVGNLPFSTTEEALRILFAQFGQVQRVRIMTDRVTQRSRGFAFVEMSQDEAAQKAIAALNGRDFEGRALKVNDALPNPERSGRSSSPRSWGDKRSDSPKGYRESVRQPYEPRW